MMACAGVVLAGSASAGDDWPNQWQNVTLERGVTMDVPQVVHDNYRPGAQEAKDGMLAAFAISDEGFGKLFCSLGRNDYDAALTQADAAAKLATRDREVLCSGLDGWTKVEIGESDSRTVSGYSAAHCASDYTKAGDKMPGHVTSVLAIAAPDGFYQFSCTLDAEDQAQATSHWITVWSANVMHMEESIRLGK